MCERKERKKNDNTKIKINTFDFSKLRKVSKTLGAHFTSKGKTFLVKLTASRDGPVKSTQTKQGLKHKTILLQKNGAE